MIMQLKHLDIAQNDTSRVNKFMANFEKLSALASATAPASNWLLRRGFARIFLEKLFGLDRRRRIPPYSRQRFTRQFARRRRRAVGGGGEVAYFVDTYVEYNEPSLGWCVVDVLEQLGFTVILPPQRGAGMPLASYGFMDAFAQNARFNVSALTPVVRRGVPIVASEPTAAYCLKHLYPYVLKSEESNLVAENSFELFEFLRLQDQAGELLKDYQPLEGRVAYHAPCHTKALFTEWPATVLLEKLGLRVERVRYGCCGIAGTYGFKCGLEGYDLAMEIQRGLLEELNRLPADLVATESSVCRMQIEAGFSKPVVHPIRLLRDAYLGSARGCQSS